MNLIWNRRFPVALCSAALVAGALFSRPVVAQDAPATPVQPQKMQRRILVHKVTPNVVAWRLDPVHNPEPVQFQASRANRIANPLIVDKANPKMEMGKLPAGIDSIIAVDPQHTLLAYGTEAGLNELEKVVALLDKRVPQVEVESMFISIKPAEIKRFGLSLSPDPKKRYSTIPLSAETLANITDLIENEEVRVITAPRVLALNNLTATLASSISTPVLVDIKTREDKQHPAINLSGADGQFLRVNESFGVTVTPTLIDDDSVSLQLAPARLLTLSLFLPEAVDPQVKTPEEFRGVDPLRTQMEKQSLITPRVLDGALFTTTIQDGRTVALTGLTSRFFAGVTDSIGKTDSDILVLVTARIVRRVDEEVSTATKP